VAQVQGRVVDDVQDAPSNRDDPISGFTHPFQIDFVERSADPLCLQPDPVQQVDEFGLAGCLCRELGIPIPRGRQAAYYFSYPEMLRTGDVRRQNSQRVRGMVIASFQGTPIQGLGGQAGDQVAHLPAKVLDHLQVAG
jgi:hypothetical protein